MYMPAVAVIVLRFAEHWAIRAVSLALASAGRSTEMSTAMIAMTTNSSISVNAFLFAILLTPT